MSTIVTRAWCPPLRTAASRARRVVLYDYAYGPLKARLQSFIDERELVSYYLGHWPGCYREMLRERGLNIEREAEWLMQRITVARRLGGET